MDLIHTCIYYHDMFTIGDDTPRLYDLMSMKVLNHEELKIIDTIAASNNYLYESFGMYLLEDKNNVQVKLIVAQNNGCSSGVVKGIMEEWLTSSSRDVRTYKHLEKCLRKSKLTALADKITVFVEGMFSN